MKLSQHQAISLLIPNLMMNFNPPLGGEPWRDTILTPLVNMERHNLDPLVILPDPLPIIMINFRYFAEFHLRYKSGISNYEKTVPGYLMDIFDIFHTSNIYSMPIF